MNQELVVCHKCLHENAEFRNFCEKCGAPIGAFTTILPFERIQAEGHAYREASSNPTKPIIVIGIWFLFAPGAALFFYKLYKMVAEKAWPPDSAGLLFGVLSLAILTKTTVNFIKNNLHKSPDNPSSK